MSKQIILDVLDHKKVDRVPVGFWWHYTKFEEWGLNRMMRRFTEEPTRDTEIISERQILTC